MNQYSRSNHRIDDPYTFLALNVIFESFRTIECYYSGEGTPEEIEDGELSIEWMRSMDGNFKILAIASGKPIPKFHQLCLMKINQIKSKVNEKRKLLQQN